VGDLYDTLRQAIIAERPVATATLIAVPDGSLLTPIGAKLLIWPDGRTQGTLGDAGFDVRVRDDAITLLERSATRIIDYADPPRSRLSEKAPVAVDPLTATVFIESFVPAPTLFIVGAVHIAIALVSLAKVLGFRTVVIDARTSFATRERFPHADELIAAWPDEALVGRLTNNSYVTVLTHDPKLDDPALSAALASPARYIGALGSNATHVRRLQRLQAAGLSAEQVSRIHGPIGLAIGARTPEEIALSILAEMIKVKREA